MMKWFYIIIFIAIGIVGSALNDNEPDVKENETNVKEDVKLDEKKEEMSNEKEESKKDDVPTEYKSALRKAETYSKTMHMSKISIYDQLTSEHGEKFTKEEADYAIEHLDD